MIETISLENFKGTTRVINLGQLNIFRGLSGSGKSTWLEAVRVAVLGHDPGYGKLLAETMSFSSAETMEVMVTNADVAVRRIFSNRGGKLTQKIFINGEGMTAKAAEPELANHFGQFPMMLNPGEFFELSDDKKITFLFGLSETDTDSENLRRKCILGILRRYTEAVDFILEYEFENADPFEMAEDTFVNFLGKSIKKVAEKDTPAGRAITKIFAEFISATLATGQETLSMYAHVLRSEINATRRSKQDAEAANRKLMEEKTEKMKLTNYSDEENQAEIERLRGEISDIEKDLHTREKLKSAKGRLASGIEVHAVSIGKNRDNVERLKGMLLSEKEKEETDALIKSLLKNESVLSKKHTSALARHKKLTEKFGKIQTISATPMCSVCGEELGCIKCATKNEKQKKKALKEIEEVSEKCKDVESYLSEIQSARVANDPEIEKVNEIVATQKSNLADYNIAVQHQKDLEGLIEEEKKNLENIEEPGAGTDILEIKVKALKVSLGERLVAEKNHNWLRTLEATIARSNETIYNSEAMLSALSVSESSVKTVRDELTKATTGAIEDACNTLLERVNPNFKLFYEIEGGKFEIQCVNVNNNTVPFKTLSGGEKVLYLSAQLLALMAIVDPKLKILEVEMGELSGNLVPPFMNALKTMTEGEDIQVVLSSCHADFEVNGHEWKVHWMGEK